MNQTVPFLLQELVFKLPLMLISWWKPTRLTFRDTSTLVKHHEDDQIAADILVEISNDNFVVLFELVDSSRSYVSVDFLIQFDTIS